MLNAFRRFTNSRIGIVITLGVLGIIALAFAAGDITGTRANSGVSVLGSSGLATVDGQAVPEAQVRDAVQTALAAVRQQQPTADMAAFIGQGGFDQVLARTINGLALQSFATDQGMAVDKRLVDAEIASIPAFQGANGQFNQAAYEAVLRQQRLTDRQIREDIARDIVARQLITPTVGSTQVPEQVALPYASLQLERRRGTVGFVPVSAIKGGAAPTDQEVATFYQRNRNRYMVPERRTMRYATVAYADIAKTITPTPAEIAAAYRASSARFAATEKRGVSQVILLDQASATALAAKVKGGQAIKAAAEAAGLAANAIAPVDKASLAQATSAAAADQVFAAAEGAVVGPVKTPLGFIVLKVDSIRREAGKTLEQATPDLTQELTKTKAGESIAKIADQLNNAAASGGTFDELIADAKLTGQTSRPLTVRGIDPDQPTQQPDPLIQRLIPAAYQAEQGDSPQIVQTDADGSFAVVAVGQVFPAAPRPLAQIRETVARDVAQDRALAEARKVAAAAVAKIAKGTAFDAAMRESGLTLPPPRPIDQRRMDLARAQGQVPAPLALAFSMTPKSAKLLEAPDRSGWFVVYLDSIEGASAAGNQPLLTGVRRGLGSVSGRELAEQFTAAVRASVGVKRNEAAIAKLKAEMAGGAPAAR